MGSHGSDLGVDQGRDLLGPIPMLEPHPVGCGSKPREPLVNIKMGGKWMFISKMEP